MIFKSIMTIRTSFNRAWDRGYIVVFATLHVDGTRTGSGLRRLTAFAVDVRNCQWPPRKWATAVYIITPSGYAVHSSRLGLLWITLLSCELAIRAPILIRLSIIIRTLVGYSDNIAFANILERQ